jgi:hypothetical protein
MTTFGSPLLSGLVLVIEPLEGNCANNRPPYHRSKVQSVLVGSVAIYNARRIEHDRLTDRTSHVLRIGS